MIRAPDELFLAEIPQGAVWSMVSHSSGIFTPSKVYQILPEVADDVLIDGGDGAMFELRTRRGRRS